MTDFLAACLVVALFVILRLLSECRTQRAQVEELRKVLRVLYERRTGDDRGREA